MLEARDIAKSYASADGSAPVLTGVSLTLEQGEFLAIVGRSGSGKSTLLNILSTLLTPDAGQVLYAGRDITRLPERDLSALRRKDFAVVFQMHHLLPYLTALENVLLPFMTGLAPAPRAVVDRARERLDRVGLAGKHHRLPGRLSGGEQQRVAIARALVKQASILFADEPTGSLDPGTGREIVGLLQELNAEGLSVVMVTHDLGYASCAHRLLRLENGAPACAA
jgi:putative ABC transport system ATP-binding protein